PTTDRVIYDTESQGQKSRNFTYAHATDESDARSTSHSAKLTGLETKVVYYFRAVAKTPNQTITSNEITFVQLPDNSVSSFGVASIFNILGPLVENPIFLWFVIIATAGFGYFQYRKKAKMGSQV
ncbi:MAG: hypothetical protein Q8L24_01615, partial [bacterium]|nr:hypothetical protein [bacterium]